MTSTDPKRAAAAKKAAATRARKAAAAEAAERNGVDVKVRVYHPDRVSHWDVVPEDVDRWEAQGWLRDRPDHITDEIEADWPELGTFEAATAEQTPALNAPGGTPVTGPAGTPVATGTGTTTTT
jgi:hypothetical protein